MHDIQKAILSQCRSDWLKVARVIYLAREQLSLPDDEGSYDLVAQELGTLVDSGELEAVGDISNWRRSEVRLPTR
jgi:hypothetical protein